MTKHSESARRINAKFYERAYSHKFLVVTVIKQLFSYDQLSKTRRNLKAVRRKVLNARKLSVLDYGFGYGTFLVRVPKQHEIAGCELSQEALKNMERLCETLRRKICLFSTDEFFSASDGFEFDLICCSHVIEHVEDDESLLQAFHTALAADGYLLLNVPINEVRVDPNHVRKYTSESARLSLANAGFHVEEIVEADRWTAWILHHEYVAAVRLRQVFRVVRFLLSMFPIRVLDFLERVLPKDYKPQQLLVLSRKV